LCIDEFLSLFSLVAFRYYESCHHFIVLADAEVKPDGKLTVQVRFLALFEDAQVLPAQLVLRIQCLVSSFLGGPAASRLSAKPWN